jgi:Protein of unknown function (DUF1488)
MSDDWRILPMAYPANVTVRGVRFAMMDHGHLVEILVTHGALDRMELPGAGNSNYLARFARHRESFERIANDKFIRKAIDEDGLIAVLAGDVPV